MCCQQAREANDDRESIEDLSVSAKLVYKTLEHEGPLTQKEIVESGWLNERTARYAIEQLKDADIIEEELYVPDARQSLYTTATNPD